MTQVFEQRRGCRAETVAVSEQAAASERRRQGHDAGSTHPEPARRLLLLAPVPPSRVQGRVLWQLEPRLACSPRSRRGRASKVAPTARKRRLRGPGGSAAGRQTSFEYAVPFDMSRRVRRAGEKGRSAESAAPRVKVSGRVALLRLSRALAVPTSSGARRMRRQTAL